jgi:hypothetical protein
MLATGCPPPDTVTVTVTVTPSTVEIEEGQTQQLSVQFNNGTDTPSFSSADASVASVDAEGLITAEGEGTTTITVTGESSGAQDMVAVTVTAAPVSLGSVSGFVSGTGGTAIPGVEVTLSTPTVKGVSSTFTDAIGFYEFDSVEVQDGLILCLRRDGFTTNCQTVDVLEDEVSSANATLKALSPATMIDPTATAEVMDGEGTSMLSIPANALVDDSGNASVGMVSVSVTVLDASSADDISAFPGNFMAISTSKGGVEVQLETFGLADVRATDESGASLTLASGMSAELEIKLASNTPLTLGEEVPLWSFDEATGMWVEEGIGTVIASSTGSGLAFSSQISHFSWWNCDQPIETKHCLSGRVVDGDGNPLAGARVEAAGVSYSGCSFATTDANGEFCVNVKRDSVVNLFATPALSTIKFQLFTDLTVSADITTCETNPQNCTALGDLSISLDACISGTLIGRDGLPEPGIVIRSSVGTTDITAANGTFCLEAPADSAVFVAALGRAPVLVTTGGQSDCATGNCVTVTLDVPELRAGDIVGFVNINSTEVFDFSFKGSSEQHRWTVDTFALFSLIDISFEGVDEGYGEDAIILDDCVITLFDDPTTPPEGGVEDLAIAPLDPGSPGEISVDVSTARKGVQFARLLRFFDVATASDLFSDSIFTLFGSGLFFQEDSFFFSSLDDPFPERLIQSDAPITSTELSWPGGLDIGPFAFTVALPEPMVVTAPFDSTMSGLFGLSSEMTEVDLSQDLQVEWIPPAPGAAIGEVSIAFVVSLTTFSPDFGLSGGTIICRAIDDGEFTIPASLLSQLPSLPATDETASFTYSQSLSLARSITSTEVEVPLVEVAGTGLLSVTGTSNSTLGTFVIAEF